MFCCLFVCSASIALLFPYHAAWILWVDSKASTKNLAVWWKPTKGKGQSRGYNTCSARELCVTCAWVYINKIHSPWYTDSRWESWSALVRKQHCADKTAWWQWDKQCKMTSCRAEPSQAGLDTRPHADTWILQLIFYMQKKYGKCFRFFSNGSIKSDWNSSIAWLAGLSLHGSYLASPCRTPTGVLLEPQHILLGRREGCAFKYEFIYSEIHEVQGQMKVSW